MSRQNTRNLKALADFQRQLAGSKYKNRKTTVDGIKFDSQAEANRYCELKMLQQTGKIIGFGRQPSFTINTAGTRYRPDFIVCDADGIWVEDVKGKETSDFRLKKREWEHAYPWLPLVLIKR